MITDEAIAVFKRAAFDRMMHEDGCPEGEQIRAGLEAVAPMLLQSKSTPPLPWSDAQMRLMGREMTAAEIRAVRAFMPLIRNAALESAQIIAQDDSIYGNGIYETKQAICEAIENYKQHGDTPSVRLR